MTAFDYTGVMWAEATRDGDAEAQQELLLRGKLATAAFWPFLAEAGSEAEFGHRLALIEDRVAAVVPGQVLEPVLASVASDWKALNDSRQAAVRTAARERGDQILESTARAIAAQVQPDQQFFDQQSGRWVTAAQSASGYKLPGRYTLPDDIAGNSHAVEGYRDARYHAANGYDWRLADGDSFSLQHDDYQQGYGRAHDDLKARGKHAYIDPSDAQRYSHYPDMNPPVDNGPLQGPDGFVTGGEGDAGRSDAVIQQRQLTPGQWTVTPGTEWPVRPNAADPTQVPRTAASKAVHVVSATALTDGNQLAMCGEKLGAFHEAARSHPVGNYMASGDVSLDRHGVTCAGCRERMGGSRTTASLHQAGEGIVPTPGPNPNYFSQGSEGIAGPPSFPENPSSAIEPKTDNRMDDLYGAVPPQVSAGSAEGLVDGQGYSRQVPGSSATASRLPFPDSSATGSQITAAAGFDDGHVHRYVTWAQGQGHDPDEVSTLKKYEQEPGVGRAHVNHIADQLYIGGGDSDWRKQAATDGRIVGHCDNCNHPVRYHTGEGGVDELRHLHNNHNRCSTGQKAASLRRSTAFFDPSDSSVRVVAAESATPHVVVDTVWGRYCTSGCGFGDGCIAHEPEAKKQGLQTRADGMSRTRPTLDNPSGAGDEYDANTWGNAVTQRPMQSAEDRGINTPTQPREPIGTVSSDPGRDDDDNRNQNGMARETALAGRSIEDLMEV